MLPSLFLPNPTKPKQNKTNLFSTSHSRIGSCNGAWENKYLTFPNNHHGMVIAWQQIMFTSRVLQLFTKRRKNVHVQSRRERPDRWSHTQFSGSQKELFWLSVCQELLWLWWWWAARNCSRGQPRRAAEGCQPPARGCSLTLLAIMRGTFSWEIRGIFRSSWVSLAFQTETQQGSVCCYCCFAPDSFLWVPTQTKQKNLWASDGKCVTCIYTHNIWLTLNQPELMETSEINWDPEGIFRWPPILIRCGPECLFTLYHIQCHRCFLNGQDKKVTMSSSLISNLLLLLFVFRFVFVCLCFVF